ncbi:MAG: protocatechuate 3,4-dioxygenase subunit beta [Gemmatimonadota bacterium]
MELTAPEPAEPALSASAPYRRPAPGTHPLPDSPEYVATRLRHPKQPLILVPHTLSEITGPVFGPGRVGPLDHDLTRQYDAEPLGERIIVEGRVVDEDGRPVPNTLLEVWQANAAGRYAHKNDIHGAPLDPNFSGAGRALTDGAGRYRIVTIKPGAYPWPNHPNAWRPAHIHFSLLGRSFVSRLVTQMYFPGDPLLAFDPIFNSVPGDRARQRLIASFDRTVTTAGWALGYHFDVVLRGRESTPMVG